MRERLVSWTDLSDGWVKHRERPTGELEYARRCGPLVLLVRRSESGALSAHIGKYRTSGYTYLDGGYAQHLKVYTLYGLMRWAEDRAETILSHEAG